jgi:hypothetical protein
MLYWNMYPRMAQFLAAIVVLSAAWLMPSLASAHTGHSHHAAAATETTVAPSAKPADTTTTAVVPTTTATRTEIARAATIASIDSAAVGGDGGCATHCCGAAAGMTCCGAALAPEIAIGPALAGSQVLLFERAKALLGQPPEALPKPPKAFA